MDPTAVELATQAAQKALAAAEKASAMAERAIAASPNASSSISETDAQLALYVTIAWGVSILGVGWFYKNIVSSLYANPGSSAELQRRAASGSLGRSILQLLTIAIIVSTVKILSITGRVDGQAAVAILAAVSGYVLRGFSEADSSSRRSSISANEIDVNVLNAQPSTGSKPDASIATPLQS